MKLDLFSYPQIIKDSADYKITIGDQPVRVLHTATGQFASFAFEGEIELVITARTLVHSAMLRPLSRGVKAEVDGNRILIRLRQQGDFCLEVAGLPNLYILTSELIEQKPSPDKSGLHYFKAGQVYEIGVLELKSGEEVYIEGGAWVRGSIQAKNASNIKIHGRGVLDGGFFQHDVGEGPRLVLFTGCRDMEVSSIIGVESTNWAVLFCDCDQIEVNGLRLLTLGNGKDGIDVCSSRDVTIDGCFIIAGDDCIVIKAFNVDGQRRQHAANTERVLAQNCTLMNVSCGRPLEIGHELLCDEVKDITFRNIDIMGCHGGSAAFSINNSSYAVVTNVLFENIRVEHYYTRLVDFRVMASRYAHTEKRGWIRNVKFKDIYVTQSIYNPGYSTSLIGGYDKDHTVDNIEFQNFRLDDEIVLHSDQLDLFTRNCSGLKFKA